MDRINPGQPKRQELADLILLQAGAEGAVVDVRQHESAENEEDVHPVGAIGDDAVEDRKVPDLAWRDFPEVHRHDPARSHAAKTRQAVDLLPAGLHRYVPDLRWFDGS